VSAVLTVANRPLLSDIVDFATVRFYGHLLRRPAHDSARFLLTASIAGLRGRSGFAHNLVPARMLRLASAAGLHEDDASTRTRWRNKNKARLHQLRVLARRPALPGGASDGDGTAEAGLVPCEE
jgi:hypothetical protein